MTPPREGEILRLQHAANVGEKGIVVDEEILIKGTVISGLGEAQFFTTLDWVRDQCLRKFGFVPVPGTLNVRAKAEDVPLLDRLNHYRGMKILPPNPAFTMAKCFFVHIRDVDGVLVKPMMEDYPKDVLEVVAPVKLREVLGLEDGEGVEVRVRLCAS